MARQGTIEERPPAQAERPDSAAGIEAIPRGHATTLGARIVPHAAVLAAFTLATIVATWPMFPQLGGFVIDKGDPLYSVWAMAWQAHALATNPLGLFDTNIMF